MSNGYIESSLKRFLKRKVKVTLGLVVAFMITGTVGFADDREEMHNGKTAGMNTAIDNLTGVGKNNNFNSFEKVLTINGHEYTVKMENNILSFDRTNSDSPLISTAELKQEWISNILKKNMDKIFADLETADKSDSTVNNIIITSNQNILLNPNKVVDEEGYKQILNNGVIIAGNAQMGNNGNLTKLKFINNGIIYSNRNGQLLNNAGQDNQLINYGLIFVKAAAGQGISTAHNSKIINYGLIDSLESGQSVNNNNATYNEIVNFGIINMNTYGQRISGKTNKGYNYGIIDGKNGKNGTGISLSNEAQGYNYGLITADNGINAGENGKGYNYGVIKVSDAAKAFSGNVENYGIVIADKGTLGAQYNTGILLDGNYNAVEKDITTFKAGDTVQSLGENDTFKSNSKGFVKNESVSIDNTQNKAIGAVVTEELENAVFNYTGSREEGLFLKNTYLTGYFEKNGTLLNVGDNDLTLAGDTHITAVKNDFNLDIAAVKIGENGKITIMDSAQINGIIDGAENSTIAFASAKGKYEVNGSTVEIYIEDPESADSEYQKYFDVVLGSNVNNGTVDGITISTEDAVKDLTNRVVIEESLTVGAVDGVSIKADGKEETELELDIKNMKSIEGDIVLGKEKDTVAIDNVDNTDYSQQLIDLGDGNDKFIANGHAQGRNMFNYNVKNAETLELNGGTWGNWNEAQGKISFDNADTNPDFVVGNSTTMIITLNAEGSYGSDFANYIKDTLGKHAVITGTDKDSVVKYLISEDGLDSSNLNTENYSFGEGVSYKDSPIFNIDSTAGEGVTISVKTGEEMGLSGQDRIIYEAYLEQIKAGNANKDVINQINGFDTQEDFVSIIKDTQTAGKAYYTAGSVVTKDITNTYLSAVEDFRKRAGKGEWLAQGKYINTDSEFDGGSSVRGYEGDITGTVGMIEYGVSENTSYGAVFGMGDSEMDINGGGNLEGDNIYAGLYMKHRTANGIELVGNLGYMENDMDSSIRSDFTGTNDVAINGTAFEKGTADSSAFVLSLKGRKDYRLSDTVRLQPTLGARATLINQEKAENPEMHFTISEQDIIVLEGTVGMGIAKDIALSNGKVELNTGVEYTFAVSNTNNDAEYTLFEGDYRATHIKMDDVDAAENTGTVYVGADYEHENGVGFNGKYEMMWSDKGDDSRITAGISYRF